MTFALLPITHSLDRHFDLFGKRGLRQPGPCPNLTHELCRIAVIDCFFAAIGHDFHNPPVGLEPNPHHTAIPIAGTVGQCTS